MHSFAPAPTVEEIAQFSDEEIPYPTLLTVPAYFGPWATDDWEALLSAEPGVIIINPDSGPGERKSPAYASLVRKAQRAGFAVIGYSSLARGKRKYDDCFADLSAYSEWYDVDGMFWDEVKVTTRPSGLLRSLYGVSVRKFGLDGFIVYNPGTAVPEVFFNALRRAYIVTFEGTRAQHVERFGAFDLEVEGPADRQWHLIHTCAPKFQRGVRERLAQSGLGGGYVTHDTLPNPWDMYAPYRLAKPELLPRSNPRQHHRPERCHFPNASPTMRANPVAYPTPVQTKPWLPGNLLLSGGRGVSGGSSNTGTNEFRAPETSGGRANGGVVLRKWFSDHD